MTEQQQQWVAQQLRTVQARHGAAWPMHREWVADYLLGELDEQDRQAAEGGHDEPTPL